MSQSLAIVDCATSEMTFDPQLYGGTGNRFETGDWVMMGVVSVRVSDEEGEGEEDLEEVEYVRPLRERETEGQIISVGRSHGYINDDIIFSLRVSGWSQMRVGDDVFVKCVEYRHHQATWRAVSMTTLTSRPHTLLPSPLSPSLPLISSPTTIIPPLNWYIQVVILCCV